MGCLARLGLWLLGLYVVFSLWRNRGVLTQGVLVLVVGAALAWGAWRMLGRGLLGSLLGLLVVVVVAGAALPATVWAPGTVRAPRYAALGDSYASGEGAHVSGQRYLAGSGACHRSGSAYPERLASTLTTEELLFVACSGATTDDLLRDQLPLLRDFAAAGSVDLVTVTIGGNDLGFRAALHRCVTADCAGLDPFSVLPGRSQTQFVDRLVGVFGQLRRAVGPDTPLLVVGYPRIFPTPAEPRCLGLIGISANELGDLRHGAQRVDSAIAEAAARVGARYVDVLDALAGHEICSDDAWAHGLTAPDAAQLPSIPSPDSFHPSPAGHRRLAELAAAAYG